jgi:DnaJ-class molecular chaperone
MVLSFGSTVYYSYISIRNIKTNKMEKRITEFGKSYWNNNGAYQEEYDKLYEELVPSRGEADTIHGEMIRAVSRLFYDFCNNGNCNVREVQEESCDECGGSGYEEEDCHSCCGIGYYVEEEGDECLECGGSGYETRDCGYCGGDCYVDGDVVINDYYQDMIDFLHQHSTNKRVVEKVEEFITRKDLGYGDYTFGDDEMKVYNDLVDAVMYQTLTTENKKRIEKDLVE